MKRFFIISTKNNFELGLGIWPARFYADQDDAFLGKTVDQFHQYIIKSE